MRKSDTKEIDGLKFTVSQLPPRKGFKLAAKLFKLIAPALGAMPEGATVDVDTLKPALMGLLHGLDDDELDTIMRSLFETAYIIREIDGKLCKFELLDGAKIDAAYEGKLPAMFQSLVFAIEVNFGDFFDGDAPSSGEASTSN